MPTPLPITLPSGLIIDQYPDKVKCLAIVPEWRSMIAQEQLTMDAETDPDRLAKYEKLIAVMNTTLLDYEAMANIDFPEE